MVGKVFLACAIAWFCVACGSGGDGGGGGEEPAPQPSGDPEFDALKPILAEDCGGCHNGSVHPLKFDTPAKLKNSKAKLRVANDTMPPGGGLRTDHKTAILGYLNK
jgi:hypothetical protein